MWQYEQVVPAVSSPLLYRGILYTIRYSGVLATFALVDRRVLGQGAPDWDNCQALHLAVVADREIYFTAKNGKVSVVKVGEDRRPQSVTLKQPEDPAVGID